MGETGWRGAAAHAVALRMAAVSEADDQTPITNSVNDTLAQDMTYTVC